MRLPVLTLAISGTLVLACVSSELKLAQSDPGHPDMATPPAAPRSGVLESNFDPLASPPPVNAGSQKYSCPMHPEIIKDEPGICPICKMKLVPVKEKHSHPGAH